MAAFVKNQRLRTKPREEFNKHRNLELLNLPPSTKGEISEFLGKFKVQKVTLNESLDKATVTLVDGSQVEEAVESLNNKMFKDSTVMVKAGYNPQLLCISHFPLSYTDEDFLKMCQKHGSVAWSFVMRSEDTGDSKGYGFVEFAADLEQSKTIKADIDWSPLEGQTLHADFLDEAFQAYEHLHSRCLLITNMPENFIDVSKLRDMFGCVTSPVYCQIIAKDEKSLGYGIIEFRTAEDAEQTWLKLRDEKIEDADVTMTFCIPGKPAVMINNRIMWKFGDKFQKSSLLPDPVTAKPVIEGNPIVISLTKLNPQLMGEFTTVLGELQQAYVSQMMSPINKPGLLGPAPSLPLSPMMNPNMQLGLLVMMAIYIQTAKKEKFAGVLAKQLNTLSEQEGNTEVSGPKPSILGDPMTGQANVILTSLKQQLNQVPLTGEDSKELEEPAETEEKIKFIVKKFVANGRYLNLSLLGNLGQLLVTMKQVSGGGAMDLLGRTPGPGLLSTPGTSVKGPSLLGPVPGSSLLGGVPQPLIGNENKGASLLGNAPNAMGKPQPLLGMGPAASRGGPGSMGAVPAGVGGQSGSSGANNASIMQAMGLNVGSNSSSNMSNMGQSLLNQISQGLVHQIGQNIMYQMAMESGQAGGLGGGRGLLGDIPNGGTNSSNTAGTGAGAGNQRVKNNKNSLLGEAPTSMKGAQQSSLDQGSWKGAENRWGSGANYESGYGNKSSMGGGYNDYGYGDSYGQQDMSSGGFGGGYGNYGDSDFYNYQQQYGFGGQTDNYQTDSGYNQYTSSGFGGMGSSGLGAGGAGSGSGGGFGMSGGYSGNQASGVNFQDGLAYGRGSSGGGLGQDNGKYGGEGYGVGMGSGGYGYGGRDDLGNSNYDSFGSVGGYGSGMGDGMGGSGGMGGSSGMSRGGIGGGGNGLMGSMPGDGGMGSTGSYSTNMGGMGGGSGSMGGMGGGSGSMGGMGGGSGSMGGMGGGSGSMGGMGSGSGSMGGMGSGTGSGMGLLGSGGSGSMGMMGSNGGGSYGGSGGGSYGGSGGGSYGGTGGSYGGTGGGSYGGGMSPIMSGSSKMGMGDSLGGMSARDQGSMSSYYQSSSAAGSGGSSSVSGLLPSPSKYLTPAGQKRSHSQLLPKPEPSPDGTDFIGQHSQGLGGHYFDSYGKRSRLF